MAPAGGESRSVALRACVVPAQRVGLRALALRFAPLLVPRSAATLPPSTKTKARAKEKTKPHTKKRKFAPSA